MPLRVGETTFGLLQFNDMREDRFTPERIALLERLGDSLAIAISQRQDQATRRASEERFRHLLESTTDYVLAKPFETAVLLRAVRHCLDAAATSKANP